MTLIRWRQPIVTRITPHNANRRFLLTGGARGRSEPFPERQPFEFEWRIPTTVNTSGVATLTMPIDPNIAGHLSFKLKRPKLDVGATNQHILNGGQFIVFLTSVDLRIQIGASTVSIANIAAIPPWIMHKIDVEWSENATTMTLACFLNGQETVQLDYNKGAAVASAFRIGNNSAFTTPFEGVLENLAFLQGGKLDGYFMDEGSGLAFLHLGEGPGTDAAIVIQSSQNSWQDSTVDIESFTLNYPAGQLDTIYLTCPDGQKFNEETNPAGWSAVLNGSTPLPAITSITVNNPRLRGLAFATPTAVVPGDVVTLTNNRIGTDQTAMNVASLMAALDVITASFEVEL